MNMAVKRKMQNDSRFLGERLRELRTAKLSMDQRDFAKLIGISQSVLSKWESGKYSPPKMALMKIGDVPGADRAWWYKQAGSVIIPRESWAQAMRKATERTSPLVSLIPLMSDAAAAGGGLVVSDHSVEKMLPLPKEWMPRGSDMRALRVSGDSMEPLVKHGYIVLVDLNQSTKEKLVGCMIAARQGDEVTVKWLREDRGVYMLVPENASGSTPVRVIREDEDWAIVGAVVRWIGEPPKAK